MTHVHLLLAQNERGTHVSGVFTTAEAAKAAVQGEWVHTDEMFGPDWTMILFGCRYTITRVPVQG